MFRYAMMLLVVAPALAGCAMEAGELKEGEEVEVLGEAEGEVTALNQLTPNGLMPNGLMPNGLMPNALDPDTIPTTSMDALTETGSAGDTAREFLKYAVSCAFDADHSFDFSWTDSSEVVHNESYPGSLALATEWQTGALSEDGQKWVTACIAARANHYGVSVVISMRNTVSSPALTADGAERSAYPNQEGAFWGNVFSTSPAIYSCYNAGTVSHARGKSRVCASGYLDTDAVTTLFCDNIQSMGECSANNLCQLDADGAKGYSACGADTRVITTFLD